VFLLLALALGSVSLTGSQVRTPVKKTQVDHGTNPKFLKVANKTKQHARPLKNSKTNKVVKHQRSLYAKGKQAVQINQSRTTDRSGSTQLSAILKQEPDNHIFQIYSTDAANVHFRTKYTKPFKERYTGLLLAGRAFGKYNGCILTAADIVDAYRTPLCVAINNTPNILRSIGRLPGLVLLKIDHHLHNKPLAPLVTSTPKIGTPVIVTDNKTTAQGLITNIDTYAQVAHAGYTRVFVIKTQNKPTPGSVVRDQTGAVVGVCVETRAPRRTDCVAIAIEDVVAYINNRTRTVSTLLRLCPTKKGSAGVAQILHPSKESCARHNDLIVAVNDTTAQNFEHVQYLIQHTPLPQVKLTLLRNPDTPGAEIINITEPLVPLFCDIVECNGLKIAFTQLYLNNKWHHGYEILGITDSSEFADIFNCANPANPPLQEHDIILGIGGHPIQDHATGLIILRDQLERLKFTEANDLQIDFVRTSAKSHNQFVGEHKKIALRYDHQAKMFVVCDDGGTNHSERKSDKEFQGS
jgi:hypothetical protein